MPKTRKERRRLSGQAFLGGRARRAHVNKPDVRRSFEEDRSVPSVSHGDGPGSSSSESATRPTVTPNVCPQCTPILTR